MVMSVREKSRDEGFRTGEITRISRGTAARVKYAIIASNPFLSVSFSQARKAHNHRRTDSCIGS